MELRPDINKLMRREIYTLLTVTLIIIIAVLILQAMIVEVGSKVSHADFLRDVWPWFIGGIVVLWVLGPWLGYLWYLNLKYNIEDERLVIQKGILTKKHVSIPYSAVTDFTLSRSLYERWLDIGTLLVQTAGQSAQASGYEGKLEGLTDFETLHQTLRAKVKAYQGSHITQPVAKEQTADSDGATLRAILEELKQLNRNLVKH